MKKEFQQIGENVYFTIDEEGDLIIKVPLSQKGRPSATGRSTVLGSTRGNQPVVNNGKTIYVGVNVYEKNSRF